MSNLRDNKSGILFLVGIWDVGGVERVTRVLAEALVARGYRVGIVAFKITSRFLIEGLNDHVAVYDLGGVQFSSVQGRRFRECVQQGGYTLIINQWCVPFATTWFIRKWSKGLPIKLISAHHSQVNTNKRIRDARNCFSRVLIYLISAINSTMTYVASDAYVVLCESFKPIFRRFAMLPFAKNLYAIPDPLTISGSSTDCSKKDIVLYVGRLEETQKRVSRVIDLWRPLEGSGWILEIIGDGPDIEQYKLKSNGLDNIHFTGFQDPVPYYAVGKILLLTSDYEGFGLVIVEAMAHGCVPVVLGSYPAVYDIIENGVDGIILPVPFDLQSAQNIVRNLMGDPDRLSCMASCARKKAKKFSIEEIVDRWERLFVA